MNSATQGTEVVAARARERGRRPAEALIRHSRLVILLLMCVALSLISRAFLTWDNLLNVLRQATPIFVLGAGQTLVILSRGH